LNLEINDYDKIVITTATKPPKIIAPKIIALIVSNVKTVFFIVLNYLYLVLILAQGTKRNLTAKQKVKKLFSPLCKYERGRDI